MKGEALYVTSRRYPMGLDINSTSMIVSTPPDCGPDAVVAIVGDEVGFEVGGGVVAVSCLLQLAGTRTTTNKVNNIRSNFFTIVSPFVNSLNFTDGIS
jgi:hypothetical protein